MGVNEEKRQLACRWYYNARSTKKSQSSADVRALLGQTFANGEKITRALAQGSHSACFSIRDERKDFGQQAKDVVLIYASAWLPSKLSSALGRLQYLCKLSTRSVCICLSMDLCRCHSPVLEQRVFMYHSNDHKQECTSLTSDSLPKHVEVRLALPPIYNFGTTLPCPLSPIYFLPSW